MKPWAREQVFQNGDDYFQSLLEDFRRAKSRIDVEVYIFKLDSLGEKILEELRAAAARGVQIRLQVDGLGSPGWTRALVREVRRTGIQVRVFRSIEGWFFKLLRRWRHSGSVFRLLNRRNHRKIVVIDEYIAYLGSMNITNDHLPSEKGPSAWHDVAVRVEGDEVDKLRQAFQRVWYDWQWKSGAGSDPETSLVRVNDSYIRRSRLHKDLISRLLSAQKRIWIVTPYFVPHPSMYRALQIASCAGVEVKLIVPRISDIRFMTWIARIFYPQLLDANVHVYEFLPRILHAKGIIIDDWMMVGSSNMNHRSLFLDLEADVVLVGEQAMRDLELFFETTVSQSRRMRIEDLRTWNVFPKMVAKLLLLVRHWL